jgi:methylthioribose-1-phosphate isomerase
MVTTERPPWHPAETLSGANYSAVELAGTNDRIYMLDQRELPTREVYVTLTTVEQVAEAIRTMVVRGAPAIGISAAYGMVLAGLALRDEPSERRVCFRRHVLRR